MRDVIVRGELPLVLGGVFRRCPRTVEEMVEMAQEVVTYIRPLHTEDMSLPDVLSDCLAGCLRDGDLYGFDSPGNLILGPLGRKTSWIVEEFTLGFAPARVVLKPVCRHCFRINFLRQSDDAPVAFDECFVPPTAS